MKLLKKEYESLMKCIQHSKIDKDAVILNKKNGWVNVQIKGSENVFSFHRKSITSMIGDRFIVSYEYYFKMEGASEKEINWNQVQDNFLVWLNEH